MPLKDWVVVVLFAATLPWWVVRIVVLMSAYGPIWLLEPNSSETAVVLISYAQGLFDALVASVPVATVLALITRSAPIRLAAAIVVGYSMAFFVWGLFASASIADLARSYAVTNHLLLVLVLGLSVFVLRKLIAGRAKAL